MRAIFLFTSLFLTQLSLTYCQSIDSIRLSINQAADSDQFELAMSSMRNLLDKNTEEALDMSLLAINYAAKSGDSLSLTKGLYAKSYILKQLERYSESIDAARIAIGIAKRNKYDNELGKSLNILANSYTFLGNYDKALDHHFQSLVLNEKLNKLADASITLNNIGLVYYKLSNWEEAIKYYKKSLEYKKKSESKYDLDRLLINMALCYNQSGEFELAKEHITLALEVCGETCSQIILTEANFSLGVVYRGQNKLKLSQFHFGEALVLSRKLGEKRFEIESLTHIASIFSEKGDYDSANFYLINANEIARNYNYSQLLLSIYKQFSEVYGNLKDYKNAALYSKKYSDLKDSTFNAQLIKNLGDIQTRFAERENLATINTKEQIIEQQRYVSMLIAITVILSGLLILFIMRINRITRRLNTKLSEEVQKQTAELVVAKVKLEKSNTSLRYVNAELDNLIYKTSHDLKGPLTTLKGICNLAMIDVREAIALDYFQKIDNTAEKLNKVLDRLSIISFIMSAEYDLETVNISKLLEDVVQAEKKVIYDKPITVELQLENITGFVSDRNILRHVLESLINNAFKYHNDSARVDSYIKVILELREGKYVCIRVLDNGIGMGVDERVDVFRLFFRASERSETGGTGLFIAKLATEKLLGHIEFFRRPVETEFRITLPLILEIPDPEADELAKNNHALAPKEKALR